jgi:hypothetical protein
LGGVVTLKGYSTLHHSEHREGTPSIQFPHTAAAAQMNSNPSLVKEFNQRRLQKQRLLQEIASSSCSLGYRLEYEVEMTGNVDFKIFLYEVPFSSLPFVS